MLNRNLSPLLRPAPRRLLLAVAAGMLATFALWACGGKNAVRAETSPAVSVAETAPSPTRKTLLDSGRVYFKACAICHGGNGRGGRGPAVANSDYAQGDRTRLIRTVLDGVHEPIRVNGVLWKTGEMIGWRDTWDDFKIAAVLTYIRAALNDSTVTACIPEDFETGTWASCTLIPRDAADIARDSVSLRDVADVRTAR